MRFLKQDALTKLSQAASIVDLAAERGLCPTSRGTFHVARCPFGGCAELVLEPATNRFRCPSCGESGNAFGLVMRLDGLRFMDALRRIAERAGFDFDDFLTEGCDCTPCRRKVRRSEVPEWALTPVVR